MGAAVALVAKGRASDSILLLGEWPALAREHRLSGRVQRCTLTPAAATIAALRLRPAWILCASADEKLLNLSAAVARRAEPAAKLAVLGRGEDIVRCDSWLRRGCSVYLRDTTPPATTIALMDVAQSRAVVVVDESFNKALMAREAALRQAFMTEGAVLTKREREVLGLIELGLTNASIARTLSLTEGTIEFHVTNLLGKLGAANRTQAASTAVLLGL